MFAQDAPDIQVLAAGRGGNGQKTSARGADCSCSCSEAYLMRCVFHGHRRHPHRRTREEVLQRKLIGLGLKFRGLGVLRFLTSTPLEFGALPQAVFAEWMPHQAVCVLRSGCAAGPPSGGGLKIDSRCGGWPWRPCRKTSFRRAGAANVDCEGLRVFGCCRLDWALLRCAHCVLRVPLRSWRPHSRSSC